MSAILYAVSSLIFCVLILKAYRLVVKIICPRFHHLLGIVKGVRVAMIIVVICSPLYYEFPDYSPTWLGVDKEDYSSVVTFDGDQVRYHPYGVFAWEWSDAYVNVPGDREISAEVTAITDNPKVRRINYAGYVKITALEKFYQGARRQLQNCSSNKPMSCINYVDFYKPSRTGTDEVRKVTAFQLFRFNSDHSKELAKFDNPADLTQQREMGLLIESVLNPALAKDGLTYVFTGFKIE